ncbi:MAG TPA: nucleotidyl transferase AbiEii/AbiGii toxin family protein [Anaerolineae bacterium]|nr:nucleotidyl transferase AbiEii/AbiGii toxin family protein [Anaerolineae bacterium]
MQITPRILRIWADENRIPDLTLAELDYRLTQALAAIYSDPWLRETLYLKGGTALNKLFFPTTNRLSIDLDFNAVGSKSQVLQGRERLIARICDLLTSQDASYQIRHSYTYAQSTLQVSYAPVGGGARQRLKLEISTTERIAILGREERLLQAPDHKDPIAVSTYRLEELASTKLRALYGRRKGRDIFDLFHISAFPLDERAVRKLTLYYYYYARMIFDYLTFRANLEEKLRRRAFADDVRGLIRSGEGFDWQQASQAVLERFAFLGELDARDLEFLDLARVLLNKPIPEQRQQVIAHVQYPLAWLMQGLAISTEAAQLSREDIQVHQP